MTTIRYYEVTHTNNKKYLQLEERMLSKNKYANLHKGGKMMKIVGYRCDWL